MFCQIIVRITVALFIIINELIELCEGVGVVHELWENLIIFTIIDSIQGSYMMLLIKGCPYQAPPKHGEDG